MEDWVFVLIELPFESGVYRVETTYSEVDDISYDSSTKTWNTSYEVSLWLKERLPLTSTVTNENEIPFKPKEIFKNLEKLENKFRLEDDST
jgi:hypothetical protein